MKKVLLLVCMMIVSISSYAQEPNDSVAKPKKFANWATSESFQAAAGFVGSYWKPTFCLAKDKESFYIVINLFNPDGFYSTDSEVLPHLYLKTEDGNIVDLEMDGEEPTLRHYIKGYFSSGVYWPGKYATSFIYYIPDINSFLNNHYVKYRVWIGESYKDVEFSSSYSKKFNKRLVKAYDEVIKAYAAKQKSLNNPLEGF